MPYDDYGNYYNGNPSDAQQGSSSGAVEFMPSQPAVDPSTLPAPDSTPAATPDPGAGGGGTGAYRQYGGPMSPDMSWWRNAPQFQFQMGDITQDPSYGFRFSEGQRALQHAAGAKGLLRTTGTLKDLINYGQGMASTEYGNAYARQYQAAKDAFAPQLLSWQTEMGARQNAASQAFQRAWDAYTYGQPSASTIYTTGAGSY